MNISLLQQIFTICVIVGTPVAITYVAHNILGYSLLSSIVAAVTLASFVWGTIVLIICFVGDLISTLSNKIRSLFRKSRN